MKQISHHTVTDTERRMSDEEVWAGYARAALSQRLEVSTDLAKNGSALWARVADAMLAAHRERFPVEG